MKTMIPPQVGMRLRTLQKNKKGQRSPPNKKMREKERRDNATISFSTLVLQNSTMIFMIESLINCLVYTSGEFFIIELGLYIPMMGFLKVP